MNALKISFGTFSVNGTESIKHGFLAEDSSFNHSDFTFNSWESFKIKYPTRLSLMKSLEESVCYSPLDYFVDENDKVSSPDSTVELYDRNGEKHQFVFDNITFAGDEDLYA